MDPRLVNRAVLIAVLAVISVAFVLLIQPFLLPIFFAALFAAIFTPLYHKFLSLTGEREALSSFATIATVLLFVITPLILLSATLVRQAVDVAQSARPWLETQFANRDQIPAFVKGLPGYETLLPFRDLALARLGELAGSASGIVVTQLQSLTVGTLSAVLSIFIMLYTMFFFLISGDRLLFYVLYYLPLSDEDEALLLRRFVSVTKATIKGTAVIGILQGGLAGLALHLAGVPSSLFWAVAMMVLSVVPGLGTALVWVPAVIYLFIVGDTVAAIVVALWCAGVVGTLDNVLRPKLVGSDTQLHELMIFFSTLGGLLLFGFTGFIIGPIIAALFVTIWELYGYEFRNWLPYTAFRPRSGPVDFEALLRRPRASTEELLGPTLDPVGGNAHATDDADRNASASASGADDDDDQRPASGPDSAAVAEHGIRDDDPKPPPASRA